MDLELWFKSFKLLPISHIFKFYTSQLTIVRYPKIFSITYLLQIENDQILCYKREMSSEQYFPVKSSCDVIAIAHCRYVTKSNMRCPASDFLISSAILNHHHIMHCIPLRKVIVAIYYSLIRTLRPHSLPARSSEVGYKGKK